MSGGSVDISAAKADPNIDAIIWVGYPGQSGGLAIAETLFGMNNPSGKLTQTFYPADFANKVSMFNMAMHANATYPGRTHRFYTGNPVYAFGTGLSYSTFEIKKQKQTIQQQLVSEAQLHSQMDEGLMTDLSQTAPAVIDVSVVVTNTGTMGGKHTVLAFLSAPRSSKDDFSVPLQSLVGYEKVDLEPGQSKVVNFALSAREFTLVEGEGRYTTRAGEWILRIGDERLEHKIMVA
jgi:hypothetical protein